MQYVSCSLMITLVALLMLQSQVANATFLCGKEQTALCVRKATSQDAKNPKITRLDSSAAPFAQVGTLAIPQSAGHFTCEKVDVPSFTADNIVRYCCQLKARYQPKQLLGFTADDLEENHCQNRGGPKHHHRN